MNGFRVVGSSALKTEWLRLRPRCPLSNAKLAPVVGKSVASLKAYGWKDGPTPPAEAVAELKQWLLDRALDQLEERGFDVARARAA